MADEQLKAEFYVERGDTYYDNEDYGRAIQNYRRALLIDSSMTYVYYKLGNSHSQLKNPRKDQKKAVCRFQRAITMDHSYTSAYFNMAVAFRRDGNLLAAIATYHDLQKMTPDDCQLYLNLAYALNKLNRLTEARVNLGKAIKVNPSYGKAFSCLGKQLYKQKRLSEAVITYNKAIKLDYKISHIYYRLGKALHGLGDIKRAIYNYYKALNKCSELYQTNCYLGHAFYILGRMQEAESRYETVIKDFPSYIQVYYFYGDLLLQQNKELEALDMYSKGIELLAAKPTNRERLLRVIEDDILRLKNQLSTQLEPTFADKEEDFKRSMDIKELMVRLLRGQIENSIQSSLVIDNQDGVEESKISPDVCINSGKGSINSSYYDFLLRELFELPEDLPHLNNKPEEDMIILQTCLLIVVLTLCNPDLGAKFNAMEYDMKIEQLKTRMKNSDGISRFIHSITRSLAAARTPQTLVKSESEGYASLDLKALVWIYTSVELRSPMDRGTNERGIDIGETASSVIKSAVEKIRELETNISKREQEY